MANISLLPHNEEALKKLYDSLSNNQMTSINHATGTGKSFIVLKYLYENKDKRILYLSPTYPIIDQLVHSHMDELGISLSEFPTFDANIYSNLLKMDMKKIASQYDIIILDEYHRCGARKWGEKVKQLLNEIKEKYPETKVIGTTATETRYLDNNKNMNKILFDGVEASRLTLADAIVQGILPAPVYINYNYTLLWEIERLERNIKKYDFYSENLDKDYKFLRDVKDQLETLLSKRHNVKEYVEQCKNFLVFSSTIDGIEKDEKIVEKTIGIPDKTYVVHSRKTNAENLRELHRFSTQGGEGISTLYSINILNEGVHVKNVDAIFMLRKTTSPIIYFQQLGRLLSYSKRNSNVVVLDMVDNICNHPIIYNLYSDVVRKVDEMIKLHPEEKEKYKKILDSFKIVDLTGDVCRVVDEVKDTYSRKGIIVRRLNTAVSILEGKIEANELEKTMAGIDIIKYEEFITIDLFDRIRELDLDKAPSIVRNSREVFIDYLDGCLNIYEKNNNHYQKEFESVVEFYEMNNRLPSIFADDEDEFKLAKFLFEKYENLTSTSRKYVEDNISDDLSTLEFVKYLYELDDLNLNELKDDVRAAISRGIVLPRFIQYVIFEKKEDSELRDLFMENSIDEDEEEIKTDTSRKHLDDAVMLTGRFQEVALELNKELEKISYKELIDKTYEEIMSFLKLKNRNMVFKYIGQDASKKGTEYYEELVYEQKLYCKKILLRDGFKKYGYLDEINNYIDNKRKSSIIGRVIDFMNAHDGALPSIKNKEDGEDTLAEEFLSNKRFIDPELLRPIDEIIELSIETRKLVLKEYIEFIKAHNRKPLSINPEERDLCLKFNRFSSNFSDEENQMLRDALKSISKYKDMKNLYRSMNKPKDGK